MSKSDNTPVGRLPVEERIENTLRLIYVELRIANDLAARNQSVPPDMNALRGQLMAGNWDGEADQ